MFADRVKNTYCTIGRSRSSIQAYIALPALISFRCGMPHANTVSPRTIQITADVGCDVIISPSPFGLFFHGWFRCASDARRACFADGGKHTYCTTSISTSPIAAYIAHSAIISRQQSMTIIELFCNRTPQIWTDVGGNYCKQIIPPSPFGSFFLACFRFASGASRAR